MAVILLNQFKFKELKRLLNLMEDMKWKYILAILLCAAVEPIYSIGFAFVNKFIFNSIEYKNEKLLLTGILIMAIIFLIYCIVQPITAYHFEGRLYYPIINIHLNLVSSIMKLPRIYFDKNHSGSIMSRLTSDLDNLSTFYREYTYDILSQSLLGLGSFIAIIFIDIRFMPIMILLGLIAIILNNLFSKKTYELSEKVQLNIAKSTQWFSDMIAGVRTIKTFNAENTMFNYYKESYDEVTKDNIALNDLVGLENTMNFLLSLLNFLGILSIGVIMINYKLTDVGTVMAIISLQSGVTSLFLNMGKYVNNFQTALVGANRIFELIDAPKEEPINTYNFEGNIKLKNVTFKYTDEGNTILDNLSITFPKGKVSAIVGESGKGKSTIFKLLLRMYPISTGELTCCAPKDIAYVPQTPYLFNDTIYENIRYGRLDATENEIIEAAKACNIHDFIMTTTDGYYTKLGANGLTLSGGQRQRIGIARAFLKNSPIILLDEPTSALDTESESLIKESLDKLFKDRTVLIISHRASTIESADNVFVLK